MTTVVPLTAFAHTIDCEVFGKEHLLVLFRGLFPDNIYCLEL